jgi:O-antigen/teichoic acid export membrane protein
MTAETAEAAPAASASSKHHTATFFRQSGWLMIANIGGGLLMYVVHFLAKKTGPEEYGIFGAFLAMIMCIPTIPLQMVLAHQTAQALATGRQRELAGVFRVLWLLITLLWVAGLVVAIALQGHILERWHVTNPAALWVTVPVVLLAMWQPVFSGVLQGQQNFLWLGWSMLANGIGRMVFAAVAVLAFQAKATGMLVGVLVGILVADGIAIWHSRAVWTAPTAPFDRRKLFAEVIPLLVGFAAFQFLFTADTMFAKSYFDSNTVGFYFSAGTMSRALMWLVGPLAAVMFPRLVHSSARAEKSNLMGLVLGGTAFLAITGAISLSILGPYLVRIVYGETYVKVASQMLPWYAGAMVPLALGNVLINNLLAKSDFRIVPGLCVLAGGYAYALTRFHDTPVSVLQTLGVCNLLLLALAGWYTWRAKPMLVAATE